MDKSTVKISVIVPIYNAAQYLVKCIDSILSQNFKDFELLLINDGSTDESGAICDEYSSRDSRVNVYHKSNGGVSSARNWGIDKANGEYLAFVDSDDYVEQTYLSSMYSRIEQGINLVASAFCYESEKGAINKLFLYDKICIDKRNINDMLTDLSYMTPWGKLFNKEIIDNNSIRFDEHINSGEDTLFVYTFLLFVKQIKTVNDVSYHYLIRDSGLSKRTYSLQERKYALDCFKTVLKAHEKNIPGADLSFTYASLVYDALVKLIKGCYSKDFNDYKTNLTAILRCKHIQWLLLYGGQYISRGIKRKLWDFLALHNYYKLLTIYSYFYRYN